MSQPGRYAIKINGHILPVVYVGLANARTAVGKVVKEYLDVNHMTEGSIDIKVIPVSLQELNIKLVPEPEPVSAPCDVEPLSSVS